MMIQQILPPQKPLLLHIINTSEIFCGESPLIPRYSAAEKKFRKLFPKAVGIESLPGHIRIQMAHAAGVELHTVFFLKGEAK